MAREHDHIIFYPRLAAPTLLYLPVGNSCLSVLSGGISTLSGDKPSSLESMARIVAGF